MQASNRCDGAFARLSNAAWELSRRQWRFVVIAMLALLHVAALRGTADGWARALLLAHLGLLLLWQPFVRGEQRVSVAQAGVIALAAVGVMLWLDWWLLAFWVVVLAGLVGGKVFLHQADWQRRYYLVVLVYLSALLAVIILPEIAPSREITAEVRNAAGYALPLLFVALAAMPVEPEAPEAPQVIDFLYSIFLVMLFGTVVLGSFTFMTLGRTSYLQALTNTVFLVAAAILALGLAWNPRSGYAGLNVFFSRYLFSIGMPIEKWLYFLAELSRGETRPERFLAEAVAGLARLPWIAGASWRAGEARGETGAHTAHSVTCESSDLHLTIHSRYRTGTALHWHLTLVGQLLAEFYGAKLREQQLEQASYMQAVHETGARLTHDVKNLLQSLNVLCSMAGENDSVQFQALVRRQLPLIAQRLTTTLDKLRHPADGEAPQVALREWWEALVRQYQDRDVQFSAGLVPAQTRVPRALFDSVADNLLQNAIAKRAGSASVRISVALSGEAAPELRVCDSGRAIPPDVARSLLRAPVRSAGSGLGIGLYEAARQAEAWGFSLSLSANRDGEVCFTLSPTALPLLPAQGSTPAEISR